MSFNALDLLIGSAQTATLNPTLTYQRYETTGIKPDDDRFVLSKSVRTEEDGTVVTTTRYSDGTREIEKTGGDTVFLSPQARSLLN